MNADIASTRPCGFAMLRQPGPSRGEVDRRGRCFTHWACTAIVSVSLLLALPQTAVAAEPGLPGPNETEVYNYPVEQGDTLSGIAGAMLSDPADWRRIQSLNAVANPRRLAPGTQLALPLALLRQREMTARVLFVQGSVSAQASGGAVRELRAGDPVRSGDLLRTDTRSTLTLALHDGSRLVVWASSRVRLRHLLAIGEFGVPFVKFGIEQGDAEMRVAPASPLRRFEVDTPAINLGVRGTEFRTRVDGDGNTRLEVLKGQVLGTAQGSAGAQALPVAAGMGLLAAPGQRLPPPQLLPTAPDLASVVRRLDALPLRLAWVAQPGADGYRVQVAPYSAAANDAAAVQYDGDVSEPALRLADLPDGRWKLRVRAIGELALQGPSAETDFVVKARPEPPFTRAPLPAARLRGTEVQFDWARNPAAHRYHLQVSDNPDGAFGPALPIDQAAVPETSFTTALRPGTYRWRLRSVAALAEGHDDPGPWGEAQAFTLSPVPQSPAFEDPVIDEGGLSLRWRAPAAGQQVQVQLARDAGFAAPLLAQTGAIDRVHLADPEPGSYFVRIRALDPDGFAGPWSAPQQVDVPRSKAWFGVPLLFLLLFAL